MGLSAILVDKSAKKLYDNSTRDNRQGGYFWTASGEYMTDRMLKKY